MNLGDFVATHLTTLHDSIEKRPDLPTRRVRFSAPPTQKRPVPGAAHSPNRTGEAVTRLIRVEVANLDHAPRSNIRAA